MSTLITIPENKRQLFGLFAASIIDKPAEFDRAWEILVKHSDRLMLTVLIRSNAQDLIYTSICYLPKKAQAKVSNFLAKNPDVRERALAECRSNQEALRMAIRDKVAEGDQNYVGLKVVA